MKSPGACTADCASEILCKRKRPFVSYNNRNLSDDASSSTTSMLLSIGYLDLRDHMFRHADLLRLHARDGVCCRRFLRMRMSGQAQGCPWDRTTCAHAEGGPILRSIQCFGAFTRLRWCLGPRAMVAV